VPGRNLHASGDAVDEAETEAGTEAESGAESGAGTEEAATPVMPSAPPFPTFQNRPSLPHQAPGGGFESGRDSRAR
jgi:hypothetical protein